MKLYEINAELLEVLSTVDENGELSEEAFERFAQLQILEQDKIEGTALYFKQLGYETDVLKQEENVLKARRISKEKLADKLKDYLSFYMTSGGKDKFETSKVVISFRKSTTCNIFNEDLIPKEYKEPQPDKILKADIKSAIKAGAAVPGAENVENKNIQIK